MSGGSLRRLAIPLAVLGVAGAAAAALLATAPETARERAAPRAPVVGVVPLEPASFPRRVEGFGSVIASREVTVFPEVEGRVVEIHPQLEPGGIVRTGEVLVRIDPAAYQAAVAGARAALDEARAALEIERGRQVVAEREWELFGADLPGAELGRELALRRPQLRQAQARIAAAESALAAARLDLERTVIRAPFDALVVRESAEVGQRVGPPTAVAELAGVASFWVQASLPLSRLPAVLASGEGAPAVQVSLAPGLGPVVTRPGRFVRPLGRVDPEGRMAQVLVAIDDPLGLDGGAAIPLGSYVRVELEAGRLEDVVAVPRQGIRENGELWVADADDRLRVRPAEIVWRQGDVLAVRNVFEPADRLIVSPLASPVPGMALRPRPHEETAAALEAPAPAEARVGDAG